MTYNNPELPSDHCSSGTTTPHSSINFDMLYRQISPSLTAKYVALLIQSSEACRPQAPNSNPRTRRNELLALAIQYEQDLIMEALAAVTKHSGMSDYSHLSVSLPITGQALKLLETATDHQFESVRLCKKNWWHQSYLPSILVINEKEKLALIASVGTFTEVNAQQLLRFKATMAAASLILPNLIYQTADSTDIDTINLALIDCEAKVSVPEDHIWSLTDIDTLLGVSGGAGIIQKLRSLFKSRIHDLLDGGKQESDKVDKVTTHTESRQHMKLTKVRVSFLEPPTYATG